MNKIVKVIIVTIAALVGLGALSAGVIFIFFPGLPTYIECKKEFPKLEEPMENFSEYSVKLSGETQLHNVGTFSVLVPAEWSFKDLSYSFDDISARIIKSPVDSEAFIISSGELPYSRILSADYDDVFFTQSDVDSYFKSLGYDNLNNMFDYMYVIYSLTWDDFNIHSKSDAQVFKALAMEKENIDTGVFLSDPIYYETAEVKGFISINMSEENGTSSYTANLFSVEDPLKNTTILGTAKDIDTFYGIVNSVTLS